MNQTLDCYVESSERVFPTHPIGTPVDVALSIIDCTTSRYAATAGVWVFRLPIDADILRASLASVLDVYPHWTGHLYDVTTHQPNDHTRRYGRLFVKYGTGSDPGVAFIVASSSREVASFIPTQSWRSTAGQRFCDVTGVPISELLSPTPLAIYSRVPSTVDAPMPSMSIQITSFSCSSVAIGVKMSHPLADARSLMLFMRHWAYLYRSNASGISPDPTQIILPLFEPSLLDAAASGDIDNPVVNPALVSESRVVPYHRYDWLKSSQGCPPYLLSATVAPDTFETNAPETAMSNYETGDPIPWDEMDVGATIQHYFVHFTPSELLRIYNATTAPSISTSKDSTDSNGSTQQRISYLDALLANIWFIINRARYSQSHGPGQPSIHSTNVADIQVHLNQTLSLRGPRLSTNLPENFLGSPVILSRVTATLSPTATPTILAHEIRSVLTQNNPAHLGARLYDKAMETSPPWRIWHGFLGKRNIMVSSWIGEGVYELDFGRVGSHNLPIYAEGVMPGMDGLIQFADASGEGAKEPGEGATSKWYHKGVDVSIHLPSDIMPTVVQDLTKGLFM